MCVGETNLLLLYADDRARLWDVKTLEFRRSMDAEKAKDLLAQGGWTELFVVLCRALFVMPTLIQVASRFAFDWKRNNHALGFFS